MATEDFPTELWVPAITKPDRDLDLLGKGFLLLNFD